MSMINQCMISVVMVILKMVELVLLFLHENVDKPGLRKTNKMPFARDDPDQPITAPNVSYRFFKASFYGQYHIHFKH